MILIIGLGNPGKKYANSRHNAGFMVIDELETLRQAQGKKAGFILAKTNVFMNESGKSVKKIISNFKIQIPNLLIIHDDIDIPIGEFKISFGRGSAGHKGVQSIINELGSKDFWRIRVGIRPKRGKPENVEKFVLQNFTKEERKIIEETIEKIGLELKRMEI